MRVFVLYSTTEGHTRKLAQFAAARLAGLGHEALLRDTAEFVEPGIGRYDAALLMASVHKGHYQQSFIASARENRAALNAMPTAFVSVSLSAAGDDPADLAGLRGCVEHLQHDAQWQPGMVYHAAGAMPFTRYGFFTKRAIRSIARKRGKIVDTSEDYDLTDYADFTRFIDGFTASALAASQRPAIAS